jgi:hypothetical protein
MSGQEIPLRAGGWDIKKEPHPNKVGPPITHMPEALSVALACADDPPPPQRPNKEGSDKHRQPDPQGN